MLMQAMLDKKKLQQTGPAGGQAGLAKTGAAVQQGPANYSGGVKPLQGPQVGTGSASPLASLAAKYAGAMGGGAQKPAPQFQAPPTQQANLQAAPPQFQAPPQAPKVNLQAAPPQFQNVQNPTPQGLTPGEIPAKAWNGVKQLWDGAKGVGETAANGVGDAAKGVTDAVSGMGGMMNPQQIMELLQNFDPMKLLSMWGLAPPGLGGEGGGWGDLGGGGPTGGGGGGGGGGSPPPAWIPDDKNGQPNIHEIPDTTYRPGAHGADVVKDTRPQRVFDPTGPMETAADANILSPLVASRQPLDLMPIGQKPLNLGGAGTVGGNQQGQTAGNIAARDAGAGANAANMPDTVYPNAKGGPLGEMADWMTSGDINRLKNNIGSFNDLNSEANTALKDNMRDFGMAGNIGNWSRDAARESANRQIDRGQQQSLRDLAAREARGGVSGTGARQGIAQAGINAQKDAELALNDRTFNDEMQRMGMLGNARNAYANQMSAGSRVDMENLLNNYTSNKELFGQMMGFIPDLIGNIIPF